MKQLFIKYKTIILYGVFGVMTTLINWATFYLLYDLSGVPNVPSVIVAWIIAVIFAFFANKLWVFESKSFKSAVVFKEFYKFISTRLLTGGLDVLIMFLAVNLGGLNANLWKIISNVIVIILNFVFGKLIFVKKDEK